MKVKKLQFSDHRVLKNLDVDFTGEHGEPLDIIVFIGDNGTGKTQLLKSNVDVIDDEWGSCEGIDNDVRIFNSTLNLTAEGIDWDSSEDYSLRLVFDFKRLNVDLPKIIWMPAELNVEGQVELNSTMNNIAKDQSVRLIEYASKWTLDDIRDYIVNIIDEAVYANRDKPPREAIEDMAKMINDIFEILDLDFELVGVATDDAKTPMFKNRFSGEEFDINSLSTGEKQLFFKVLSLKRLKINNAIIIIDEPETSLHPEWQRKIIEVYKQIGNNNQLIIATHSPFIVGSVPSESIRIMFKDNGKIKVLQQDGSDKSYGKSVEDILKVTMDLDSLRDVETTKKINEVHELLENEAYKTSEYERKMNELKTQLGTADKDIMRIEMAKSMRMRQNAKSK